MTTYRVYPPSVLRTEIELPRSKSLSNRALCISALAGEACTPVNLAKCDDTDAMQAALDGKDGIKDIGAAGTAMRFLTAYFAATSGTNVLLTGSERMKNRPIGALVEALRTLGADIEYAEREGFPPLHITGRQLRGGSVVLPGNISSQYVSALLMVAPTMQGGLILELEGEILSRPYIDMTLGVMKEYGAKAEWTKEQALFVEPQAYVSTAYEIEADWSAASYWYEMVALSRDTGTRVALYGLTRGSLQGDSRVAELFDRLGVRTQYTSTGILLTKTDRNVETYTADLGGQPDLGQTLVATCAVLGVPFYISGLQNLRIKETDRIAALMKECSKLGIEIEETGSGVLRCSAPGTTKEGSIETYDDHRMAMAFAPACLHTGCISVQEPSVVTKSYPGYWQDLRKAGFIIEEV